MNPKDPELQTSPVKRTRVLLLVAGIIAPTLLVAACGGGGPSAREAAYLEDLDATFENDFFPTQEAALEFLSQYCQGTTNAGTFPALTDRGLLGDTEEALNDVAARHCDNEAGGAMAGEGEGGSAEPGAATDGVVTEIAAGQDPTALAVGEGAVWVASRYGGTIGRIDLASRELTDTITVAEGLTALGGGGLAAVAVGEGAVWVLKDGGDGTVSRIDPTSRTVTDTITAGAMSDMAVGEGAVWVTSVLDNKVWRIDPARNEVTATIELGNPVSYEPVIAIGEDAVWIAGEVGNDISNNPSLVWRIDPDSNELTDTITVENDGVGNSVSPTDMAVGEGAVWIATRDGRVTRIDAASREVTTTIGADGGEWSEEWSNSGVAVGEGAVWVNKPEHGTVSRIDPDSQSVTDTVTVTVTPTVEGTGGVAVGGDAVWAIIREGEDRTVSRIEP